MLKWIGSSEVASLGLYCERLALGAWQEPYNTLSALAFILVGLLGFRLCFGAAKGDALRMILALCMLSIGVTSFLFHMMGTRLSLIYDLLPILLFDVLVACAILSRGLEMKAMPTFMTTLVVVATSFALTSVSARYGIAFSGIEHAGFVFWLIFLALALLARGKFANGATLLLAGGILIAAIFAKSIDIPQCAQYKHGTHWLWHMANALASYLIILGIPLSQRRHREVEVETRL